MNKIISMSLWGNNPRYSIGAIRNAALAKKYFPEWRVRIYHDDLVNVDHLVTLSDYSNVDLINFSENKDIAPCFWRFLAAFESDDNIVLSRDTDSRLSQREKECVEKWLTVAEKYSIIRDHVRHYDFPMLAGMWGYKGKLSAEFLDKLLMYAKRNFYTIDQIYLHDVVWKEAQNDSLIFGLSEDPKFNASRFEILPNFIGQGYDENDMPIYPTE
jgi:hypothetical protein